MLLIEIRPLSNGAHRNQRGVNIDVPKGWVEVPLGLEEKAMDMLPFVNLVMENGVLTDVEQGIIPEPQPEPEPEPSTEDDMMSMAVDHEYRLTLLELGVI